MFIIVIVGVHDGEREVIAFELLCIAGSTMVRYGTMAHTWYSKNAFTILVCSLVSVNKWSQW
jgi:hypothetical protein